ncbi:MAG: sigma-54-dependent Fis family transcriptional regulator [Actinobacteria bacterium TMED172]|nr:sigma-54-dependent Fis family transcriptional regulator [Cellvibrionales bacterium]OUW32117.1 MAG: sigma-54-dependent Fis family transcriptional regulator [Actinobacteria bacterium TMED172]|tara:strand:+ start:70632 stop:72254 length:1623 start_codon:yes stop_codon:yes gene_type:complete
MPNIKSNLIKSEDTEPDLAVIHEAAKLIGSAESPTVAITSILRLISQMLGLNRGRVLLPSITNDKLTIRYSYGLLDEEQIRGVYSLNDGITGKVMQSGRQAVIQNIDDEPDFLYRAVSRSTLPKDVVSFIAVPIFDGNVAIGVLGVHRLRKRRRSFNADLIVLKIISTFIAQIIKVSNFIDEKTQRLRLENDELKDALSNITSDHGILGESQSIRDALKQILMVSETPVTVLLTGESGTGKERFSQVLHLNSPRKDKPFLAINCGAIPEQLLESELFGYEKGAFTGANQQKKGKFELANNGTLFLDEIGDLSLELQTKLLRVLENRVIQRVGGLRDIPIDVRIVTATHKNLQNEVNIGNFRLDLFYRLNVFPIHLPPLKEREGDIRILSRHFLLNANREYLKNTVLSKGVLERLESFSWPGNIRQLENVIKRAVLIAQDGNITSSSIELILAQESLIRKKTHTKLTESPKPLNIPSNHLGEDPSGSTLTGRPYNKVKTEDTEKIIQALTKAGGNKTRAAALLGMTPRQFRYRMERLQIVD